MDVLCLGNDSEHLVWYLGKVGRQLGGKYLFQVRQMLLLRLVPRLYQRQMTAGAVDHQQVTTIINGVIYALLSESPCFSAAI